VSKAIRGLERCHGLRRERLEGNYVRG
jgi:hypothetical protein